MYGYKVPEYTDKPIMVDRVNEITVLENINLQIKRLNDEINRLESAKERLSASGLANIRIDDLRLATDY